MTKDNLIKKVLNYALPVALGIGSAFYSSNANAQKPEEAQEFGTAMIGGKPAKVSLSEYFGSSYLSVPTDDKNNELGREFYPFLTDRGTIKVMNSEGKEVDKDTTNIVSWKSRDGFMEDLKSEITYVPKKIEGKYLIQLMNKEDSPTLGIEITEAKINKEGDAISGKVEYESGKIEDVIRTVKFPDENKKYYLLYRDHNVDSAGVMSGKKTPFVLVGVCGDKEPIYHTGKTPFFEGEIYEFIANTNSDLKKIVDKDGKSLIYSEAYLNDNKAEIDGIRSADRNVVEANQKRGIPGHVKEFLEEGEPCDGGDSCKDGIKNQGEKGIDCGGPCPPCGEPSKLELRASGEIGTCLAGLYGIPSFQVKVGDKLWAGIGGFGGNGMKTIENTFEVNPNGDKSLIENTSLYVQPTGSLTDKRIISPDYGLIALVSYDAGKYELDFGVGAINQKITQTITHPGTVNILDANGNKIAESSVPGTTEYTDSKFGGLAFLGGLKAYPTKIIDKGPDFLKNFYLSAKGIYVPNSIEAPFDSGVKDKGYGAFMLGGGVTMPLTKQ